MFSDFNDERGSGDLGHFHEEKVLKLAYDQGYDIGRLNRPAAINDYAKDTTNPFTGDSQEYSDWYRGFRDAVNGW